MGGGIGAQIIQRLKAVVGAPHSIVALGTNANATSAMVKAGADIGATGENAIIHNATKIGCVCGPIGIVIPNSMMGEISPAIATAVASSDAIKVLIPLQQAHVDFVGVESRPLSQMLDQLAERVAAVLAEEG